MSITKLALALFLVPLWLPRAAMGQEEVRDPAAAQASPQDEAGAMPAMEDPQGTPAPRPEQPGGEGAAAAGPAGGKTIEEILVTGSRIRRLDLKTAAPVTVLGKDQLVNAGKVSIGDILQTLPEQGNAINTQANNGGDGSTRVNLRSLGPNRTLVLVNGRRHVPGGTGANSSVDLNAIPPAVIERVEVLKDGASAVYGSDAIGGVMNLITRKEFSGTELTAYSGMSPRGDGEVYDLAATLGKTTEDLSIVFSANFFKQKKIMSGDREFSKLTYTYDFVTQQRYPNGSPTPPAGTIRDAPARTGGNAYYRELFRSNQTNIYFFDRDLDGWRDFVPSSLAAGFGDTYNFQPDNYLLTPSDRYSLFSLGSLNLGDAARVYYEASFTNRESGQLLAAEPVQISLDSIVVSRNSIYNPFGKDLNNVNRRISEGGSRLWGQDIDTFRFVGGLDGTFPEVFGFFQGWFWDASFSYGRTTSNRTSRGLVNARRLQTALGPSFIDATGVPRCGVAGAVIADCVPVNLTGGPGTLTREMLDYVMYNGTARGYSDMTSLQVNVSGELFPILGDRPMGLALGAEHRLEAGGYMPDPVAATGETTGNTEATTEGDYMVQEAYAELSLPVISDVFLVDDLEFSAAARVFNYNTFGTGSTWKLGGRWRILPDVTLRGTLSTAFRAPNIGALYGGSGDGFPGVTDPCDRLRNPTRTDIVQENCTAEGVPNDLIDGRTQIRTKSGGNLDLEPETADIMTGGVVFEPSFIEGLSLTVDYFKMDIDNAIDTIGARVILNACYGKADRSYCDRIIRDPNNLLITDIINTQTNVGGTETSGWDFALRYDLGTDVGRFGFNVDFSLLNYYDQILGDGTVVHAKETYDLSLVLPTWKAQGGVRWGYEGLGVGVNARVVDGYKECRLNDCGKNSRDFRNVETWAVYNAFASYELESPAGRTTLSVGVNNVLDRKPALLYNGFTAGSDTATYDYLGRFMYARLQQSF